MRNAVSRREAPSVIHGEVEHDATAVPAAAPRAHARPRLITPAVASPWHMACDVRSPCIACTAPADTIGETTMANQGNRNNQSNNNQGKQGSGRGCAGMDEDKQREIASQGGKAAHEKGTAHEFSSQEAREAGRKGGEAVSKDRQHMSDIGRKGGQSSGGGNR
jgi:uncharacterized protein